MRRGRLGDLEVRAPRSGEVELHYAPGAPEIIGLVLSAAGVVLSIVAPRYFTAAAPASEHS